MSSSEMFQFTVMCFAILILGGITSSTVIQISKERSAATVLCIVIGTTPFLLFALFAQALPPIEATPDVIRPIFRIISTVAFGVIAFGGGMVIQAVASHVLYIHSKAKLKRANIPN